MSNILDKFFELVFGYIIVLLVLLLLNNLIMCDIDMIYIGWVFFLCIDILYYLMMRKEMVF